ncbi:MAG: amidohydrolase [Planctomycetota bacterium]|nr:amidohydrolase [Planctomycetota bacterium]
MHRLTSLATTPVLIGTALLATSCSSSSTRTETKHASMTVAGASAPLALTDAIDARIAANAAKLVEWRRHLHQHPELSNREVETARFVAERLREMGLTPTTGIAKHGVKAVIVGGKPGPVVALRADMDALPVKEEVDLPFKSTATGTYEGKTVSVMHACGHDAHTSMLLAAADALQANRAEIAGQIVLIFQPAEEGVPRDEYPAGAELMVKEGVLLDPKVDVVFGLHVFAGMPTGVVGIRSGPVLAAADKFEITVEGHQTHGSKPWGGIDPIMVGSEIVGALQTIVSRGVDLTKEPVVVTVGQFESGVRNNIIPDRARLVGTIRTFDAAMRDDVHAKLKRIAEKTAEAHGARAIVKIEPGYPVTANDANLVERMRGSLERTVPGQVEDVRKITGAEDFSYYAHVVPGLFVFLGVTPKDKVATADSNHSPRFFLDENALTVGARVMARLAVDYASTAVKR